MGEIAAGWTQQPGFPVVKVVRHDNARVGLAQERFTLHFTNAPALEWKIPLTYALADAKSPTSLLITKKTATLENIPGDRALKLNVEGTGNYRVQYDARLLGSCFSAIFRSSQRRTGSISSVMRGHSRKPIGTPSPFTSSWSEKLPCATELAEREQVINAFEFIDGLLAGTDASKPFRVYARSILQRSFEQVGWEPKPESPRASEVCARVLSVHLAFWMTRKL